MPYYADSNKSSRPSGQGKTEIADRVAEERCDGWFLGAGAMVYPPETALAEIPPILPRNGAPVHERIIEVNGILTDVQRQFEDSQALANTGAEVIGVHNSTYGVASDVAEFWRDRAEIGCSPAVATLCALIRDSAAQRTPLHLAAHSQGALMVARALSIVALELEDTFRLQRPDIASRLSHIRVETYGGAAARYVDGPQYVHVENVLDPVSQFLGVGLFSSLVTPLHSAGKGAVIHRISECNTDLSSLTGRVAGEPGIVDAMVHGPRTIYFPWRRPFEEMRRDGRRNPTAAR